VASVTGPPGLVCLDESVHGGREAPDPACWQGELVGAMPLCGDNGGTGRMLSDAVTQAVVAATAHMEAKVTKLEAQLRLVPSLVEQVVLLKAEVESAARR